MGLRTTLDEYIVFSLGATKIGWATGSHRKAGVEVTVTFEGGACFGGERGGDRVKWIRIAKECVGEWCLESEVCVWGGEGRGRECLSVVDCTLFLFLFVLGW